MKIGIDGRFLGSRSKGLGRYTEQLVRNIEALDPQHDFIVFLRKENWDDWSPTLPRFKKVLADFQWYSLEEQIKFPRVLREAACDLYHSPHFNVPLRVPKPFIVTIHDLILSHFPTVKATTLGPAMYWIKHQMYKVVMHHALKHSKHVISVSNFTKEDLIKTYGLKENDISVTYEGIYLPQLTQKKSTPTDVYSYYGIPQGKFLLYVGNAYPHKNLEFLIDGFIELQKKKPHISLVCIGKHDYFYNRIIAYAKERGARGVFFPGYVSDEDLNVFYEEAQCYVFPSLYEGFGLPPLEAMAQGTPVVSSNASCLPEILGSAAAYFSPHDVRDMISVVNYILDDTAYADDLRKKGLQQIEQYSWKRMAEKTLSLYETNT